LDYLDWLWKQPSKPDRLRFQAAAEVAKYRHATLKATAKVTPDDFASVLERARARVAKAANVIQLQVGARAIVEHDPSELRPDVKNSPGAQSPNGFRRRF
jgi:hypothetical protein